MEITPYPKNRNYGVTEDGRVFRIVRAPHGRAVPYELNPVLGKNGYFYVGSGNKNSSGLWTTTVHRMVAETFIPNPMNLPEVAHNNGVRHDCRRENLRWDTRPGNAADRKRHGTAWLGTKHKQAKLTEQAVRDLRAGRLSTETTAFRFDVTENHARKVKRGEGWTHV